jgi:glutamine synthetase
LFGKSGVLNKTELEALQNVQFHSYCTKLDIEAKTLAETVHASIMPAVIRYQTELAGNIAAMKAIGMEDATAFQKEMLQTIVRHVAVAKDGLEKMEQALEAAHHATDLQAEAHILCDTVKPQMERIREAVDELEGIVADQYWPLVKYREMLFVR